MPTIFTRIVNGDIPAAKISEDAETLAFLDISPASRGHALVVCKTESANLMELSDADVVATARTTQRVAQALMAALQPDGINVVQNNGAAAGQTVFHYHVHVIPRWHDDGVIAFWQPGQLSADEARALLTQIQQHLRG